MSNKIANIGAKEASDPSPIIRVCYPSDTITYDPVPRALYIGVAGNLAFKTIEGQTITVPVPVGVLPFRPYQILSTGTTATSILLLY